MLNLKHDNLIKPSRNELGDQGFINELYLWERLDLGLQHDTIVHLLQVDFLEILFIILILFQDQNYYEYTKNLSIVIYHFAGKKPELACETITNQWHPCKLYDKYTKELTQINKDKI